MINIPVETFAYIVLPLPLQVGYHIYQSEAESALDRVKRRRGLTGDPPGLDCLEWKIRNSERRCLFTSCWW